MWCVCARACALKLCCRSPAVLEVAIEYPLPSMSRAFHHCLPHWLPPSLRARASAIYMRRSRKRPIWNLAEASTSHSSLPISTFSINMRITNYYNIISKISHVHFPIKSPCVVYATNTFGYAEATITTIGRHKPLIGKNPQPQEYSLVVSLRRLLAIVNYLV